MVLDITVEELTQLIGHTGSAELYDTLPGQKAGFHEQECIEAAQLLGYACTPTEVVPQMMPYPGGPIRSIWFPGTESDREENNWRRFKRHLTNTCGVITGLSQRTSSGVVGHAVAWDGDNIYDSRGEGFIYSLEEASDFGFTPRTYWKIQEVAYA
jgi:hypothetical protein